METTKIQMLFQIHFQTEIALRQEVASQKKDIRKYKQKSKKHK